MQTLLTFRSLILMTHHDKIVRGLFVIFEPPTVEIIVYIVEGMAKAFHFDISLASFYIQQYSNAVQFQPLRISREARSSLILIKINSNEMI